MDAKQQLGDLFPKVLLKLLEDGEIVQTGTDDSGKPVYEKRTASAASLGVIRAYLKDNEVFPAKGTGSPADSLLELARTKGVVSLKLNKDLPPIGDEPDQAVG